MIKLRKLSNDRRRSFRLRRQERNRRISFEQLECRRVLAHYFVDAMNGNDGNAGTVDSPLKTYLPFVSAWGQDDPNIGRIDLEAGDIVEFAAGEYSATFQNPGSPYQAFYLRNIKGNAEEPIVLRGAPGTILAGAAPNENEVTKLVLFEASNVIVEGFEITGYGTGLSVLDSSKITLRDNWIHDNYGDADRLISGIDISQSAHILVTANLIHDNFDRDKVHDNSRNVQFNENTGLVEFENNIVFNSTPPDSKVSGTGVSVKHLNTGPLHIHHNVISNQWNGGVVTDTAIAEIHHNLILNSDSIVSVPNEQFDWYESISIFNNTIVDQDASDTVGGGLKVAFPPELPERPLGTFSFEDNIVYDQSTYDGQSGIHQLGTYQSDELYETWIESKRFKADNNVYFNPTSNPQFNLFNPNDPGGRNGSKGGEYSFEQWQALGFDRAGAVVDPKLDNTFQPHNAVAAQSGWYADEEARLTLLTDDDIVREGDTSNIIAVRSGSSVDIGTPLVVHLSVTDQSEITFPETVIFGAGQTQVNIPITAKQDHTDDGTQATRIDASAEGFSNNISTWVRIKDRGNTRSHDSATYYVDAINGNDSNPGTVDAPLKSYLPFVFAWGPENAAAGIGRIDLKPGDIVEFAPGVYSDTYRNPGDSYRGFHLRDVFGTAESPIILRGQPGAVLDTQPPDNNEGGSLTITGGGWFEITGFEFTGYGKGLIVNGDNILVQDNYFHNNDGTDNFNQAALYVAHAKNVEITSNLFVDNFDRTNADTNGKKTENSRHAVFFANPGKIKFHDNRVLNTVPTTSQKTGVGVTVKHGDDGSFEADHNVMSQLWFHAFGTSTPRSNIHHNLIVDSGGLHVRDFGGAAYFNEMVFANNTLTAIDGNTGSGFSVNMHECWYGNEAISTDRCNPDHTRPIESFDTLGPVAFNDNIVVDHRSNTQDRGIVRISTYGTDERYEMVIEQHALLAEGNVYHNTAETPQFNVFNVNGGTRGEKGAAHGFDGWQALGFDSEGTVAAPQFDDVYMPQNSAAVGAGWYADSAPRISLLVLGEESITEAGITQVVAVRSGDGIDLQQPMTVNLSSTDPTEINTPTTISFAPGQSKAYFEIAGVADGEVDGTRAVRLFAEADGFSNNVSAWVRVEDSMETMPGISVLQTNGGTVVGEDGSTDSFDVRLAAAPNQNVILDLRSSDVGEASTAVSQLVFTPSNWSIAQTVIVEGVDDTVLDGPQTSEVTISVNSGSDALWLNVPDQQVVVTTTDNDSRQDAPGYQGGILVLPGDPSEQFEVTFDWTQRLGEYDNELGVYIVDDIDGTVDGIAPDAAGYAGAALNDPSRHIVFESGLGAGESNKLTFRGGQRLGFYMIQNATTAEMLARNPGNDFSIQPMAFFSLVEANGDATEHVRVENVSATSWRFGWEDLVGGGDESYTDAVIDVSVSQLGDEDLVFLDLEVTNADGQTLTDVYQGETFFVDIYASDLRSNPTGVYSAALDIEYDDTLAAVQTPIVFGANYPVRRKVDLSQSGLIDELGAVGGATPTNTQRTLLARVPMQASAPGALDLTANPADILPEHDITLVERNSPVPTDRVRYDSEQVTIKPPRNTWHNSRTAVDVNDDGFLSPIDALLIINMLNARGAKPTGELPVPDFTALVDTNDDGFLAPSDVLLVISALNRDSTPPEGEFSMPLPGVADIADEDEDDFAAIVDGLLAEGVY